MPPVAEMLWVALAQGICHVATTGGLPTFNMSASNHHLASFLILQQP